MTDRSSARSHPMVRGSVVGAALGSAAALLTSGAVQVFWERSFAHGLEWLAGSTILTAGLRGLAAGAGVGLCAALVVGRSEEGRVTHAARAGWVGAAGLGALGLGAAGASHGGALSLALERAPLPTLLALVAAAALLGWLLARGMATPGLRLGRVGAMPGVVLVAALLTPLLRPQPDAPHLVLVTGAGPGSHATLALGSDLAPNERWWELTGARAPDASHAPVLWSAGVADDGPDRSSVSLFELLADRGYEGAGLVATRSLPPGSHQGLRFQATEANPAALVDGARALWQRLRGRRFLWVHWDAGEVVPTEAWTALRELAGEPERVLWIAAGWGAGGAEQVAFEAVPARVLDALGLEPPQSPR